MAIQAQMYSGTGLGMSPQDLLMDNACGLNNISIIQQQHRPQQDQQLMQRVDPFVAKNTSSDQQSMAFSQIVSTHVENQRMEVDLFINSQNERLRAALQEQRNHQMALFMKKYESKIQNLIKQREDEIVKATNRTVELQNFLKRMEIESQTWQRAAQENEAMVTSLNSAIERLRETAGNAAEDAESCCIEGKENTEWNQKIRKRICRCCNFRTSCVIMLPCRHLCSCKECEVLLHSCPVCKMLKKASIEAFVE